MTDPVRGAMTPARMKRIWEREGGICWFCTKPVPPRGGHLVRYDHRIPFEIIGHDGDENIYPIHREPCDRLKTAADQAKIAKVRRQAGQKGQWARRERRQEAEAERGVTPRPKQKIAARGFEKGIKRPWPKRTF